MTRECIPEWRLGWIVQPPGRSSPYASMYKARYPSKK